MTTPADAGDQIVTAFSGLRDRFDDFVAILPLLGVALALVVVFALLARWTGRWDWFYERLTRNAFARDWLRRAVTAAVMLVGVVLALEVLDATALVGAVLGAAGVAGLALGFAFRDTAENYIAGLLLSLRQPFAPNDFVAVERHEGKVVRLTPRATILMTVEGNHVRIPNAAVFKSTMVNYTRNPRRRFQVEVGVGTEVELAAALDLGAATLAGLDGVLEDPPPRAWIEKLGDSTVALVIAGWVDQRGHDYLKVRSEGIRAVKEAFDDAGFDMPEPIYRLRVSGEVPTAPAERRPERPPEAVSEPPAMPPGERDTSPDLALDREVAADREATPGDDLLDPTAPKE